MKMNIIIHAPDSMKEVATRLVNENINNKIDSYIRQFDKPDAESEFNLTVEKWNKEWLYSWKLHIFIDWNKYDYAREDYKNLDDLINNLFKHFKEEISK